MRQNKTRDLREVIMNLAPAYEQWYAKTKQEGKQEGELLGMIKGKQLGITEGKQAQSIQTARRMLGRNMPLEEIAELTDLPLDRIQALQAESR
jgi:predicted transposase/invertase (TIGR01784 family)